MTDTIYTKKREQNNEKINTTNCRNALWVDKYAPSNKSEILGNQSSVNKLIAWLNNWELAFNSGSKVGPNDKRAVLISGPTGIGKTTCARLVSESLGRHVMELNASDARSKLTLQQNIGDCLGSQVLNFAPKAKLAVVAKKRVLIMDEVDGMGAGDRSGMAELINMIKESRIPIICICNDRSSSKVRSLANHCLDLKFMRPIKTIIVRHVIEIGHAEGMQIENNAAETLVESCGNDIRQVLNALQMWASKSKGNKENNNGEKIVMKYMDFKSRSHEIGKDEMLRVSMFEAGKLIIEGPKSKSLDAKGQLDDFHKRNDAFFSDYSLMGILVHQNYPKILNNQLIKVAKGTAEEKQEVIDRTYLATAAMSDYAVMEGKVHGGDQHWELLTACGALAVKVGFHAGGENGGFLPGYPEFPAWLGKNSSRGKHVRLLSELQHHLNKIVSSSSDEIRMGYIPLLRDIILKMMKSSDSNQNEEVIKIMDAYGLSREDVFETFDDFSMSNKNSDKFSSLDSKKRAGFTRMYNQRVHKSQALVAEQGFSKKKKAKVGDEYGGDGFDEDGKESSQNNDNDDDNVTKDISAFMKKGKKLASAKEKNVTNSSKKKK